MKNFYLADILVAFALFGAGIIGVDRPQLLLAAMCVFVIA